MTNQARRGSRKELQAMTRGERALKIHGRIVALDAEHGRWERPVANLPDVRVRVIDAEAGWEAWITTPFSGPQGDGPDPKSYDAAVALERHLARQLPNTLDLWLNAGPKVLSVGFDGARMHVISMKPGPWEGAFQLPARKWAGRTNASLLAAWPSSA